MAEEHFYQDWLQRRANAETPAGFSDRIMKRIEDRRPTSPNLAPGSPLDSRPVQRLVSRPVRQPERRRTWLRIGLCGAALMIGAAPFWVVAYVAHLLPL